MSYGLFDDLIPAPARSGVPAGFDAHLAGLEARYRLPAGTLGAVMAVESGGNPDAVSPAGARGAFQFMPATAQRFGIDPLDPYQAADGAARYLRANLDQFGDRLDLALAGYNAGENRQSLREGRIPEIPETQAYVRKVMARLPGGNAPAPAAGGLFDDLIPTPAATSAAAAPPAGATSAPPSLDAPAAQAAPPESVPDGGLFADLIPQPPGAQGDGLSRAVGDGRAVWPAEPNPAVASGFVPPAAGTPAFDAAAVRAEAGPVDDSMRGLLTRLARVFGGGFTQTLSPTEQIGLAADTAAGGQQVQLLGRDPAAQLVPGKSTAEQAAFLSGALAKQGLDPLNLLLALGGGAAGPAGRVLQGASAGGAQGAGAELVTQLLPEQTVQALRAAGLGHLVTRDGGFDLQAVLRAGLENAALGAGFDAVMGGGTQALRAVDGRLPAPVRDSAAGGAGGSGGASGAAAAVDPALASVGPDGVVIPNREVVDGLPGLDGRAVRDVPAAAAAAPVEAGAGAPAGAAAPTPDAAGTAAPAAGAAASGAVPARAAPRAQTVLAGDGGDLTAAAGARAAEFERLAGMATDPEVAAALRRLADGAPPPSSATHEVVVTPGGRSVETAFEVVDAPVLVTSDRPEFPPELQPRERGQRVASDAQIAGIAGRLDPEQLAGSRLASTGAPIVGPDGVVESGNGRVAAIRRAYAQDGPQAQAYREMLARMGFDTEGMQAPVLIRRRTSELTPEERVAFTVDANRDATAALSVAEQARADARALDDTALGMWASGAASDAGNVGFAREFIRQTGADPAAMLTADGRLSAEGVRRIDAAWLARAYDDADLLARLTEDPEPNIKALGGAYLDAAPAVARLRAGVARGEVPAELDLAPGMTEAARLVATARRERRALSEVVAQGDMLGGGPSAEARAVLGLLFRDGELKRALSRERMGELLNFYAQRAAEVRDGAALFDDLPAVTLDDVLAATRRQKDAITENSAPAEPGGAAAGAGGEAAGAAARGSGSAAAGGADGSRTAAGARAAGPEEAAPLLSAYDAADLRAREQTQTAAEAARTEAERRAEVQRSADDFSMTGSDRPADANPGQADLLDVTGRPTARIAEDRPRPVERPAAGTIYDPQPLRAADGAVALGRTVKHVEVGQLPTGLRAVQDAADVAHAIAGIRRDAQEALYALVTDAAGQVLRVARVARGAVTEAPIDAGGVAGAITSTPGAARAWIAHNHPSGVVRQSAADTALAQRLADLLDGTGIEFGGSVVVGPGGRVASLGDAMVTTRPAARRDALAVSERRLSGRQTQTQPVTSSQEAHAAATQAGGSADGVLLLDAQMRPVGWVEMTGGEMRELRTGAGGGSARLQAAMDEVNAVAMIPRTESRAAVGNLHAFGQAVGREMVDALDRSGRSWERRGEIPTQSTFYANPLAPAAAQLARDVRAAAGPAALAAAGGAVYGATRSDAEVGTARWWLDVVAGGGLGATVAATARGLHLVGRDSFAARSLSRLGTWIDELPLIGRSSVEVRELKAKQRLMREILDRQTAEVGKVLRDRFTPAERAQIADLIEERGYVRELGRVHRQAAELDDYLRHVGERMQTLGMLPQELDLGGYLHRYYAKHLGLDADGKAARRQSLAGSYSIARGTEEIFQPEMLSPGVRERLARIEQLQAELDGARRRQQRKGTAGDLAVDEIRAELHALRGEPVHEYIGEQGGEPRSFFFTADEVPHVDVSGLGLRPEGNRTRAPANPGEGLAPETGARLSTTERVWTVRGTRDGAAVLHRDWTKAERQHWGEIEDAGYRYVRGMAEASHDLSLATMFKAVAERPGWASREARPGWVAVPDSRIGKGSALRRYGALSGMYVEPKVWAAIRSYARPVLGDGPVATAYMGALRRWKAWHTVYNPVTHFNNLHSNTEMLFLSGYGPADLGRGLREMIRGERSPVWREARDAGLFEHDFAAAELAKAGTGGSELTQLADELLRQTDDADVSATVGRLMQVKEWAIRTRGALTEARGPWQTGAALAQAVAGPLKVAKAPLDAVALAVQKLYTLEDELFKAAVFTAERRKGASVAQAVEAANRYFFDYSDVPEAVRIARDFPIGSPFISYTYKAIPAIARTFAERPERALALAAAFEAINYAALITGGLQPGEYWAVRRAEDDLAPEWERGRAIWGGLNNVHIPYMDGYRLALGNAHAAGNPFASEGGERRASLPVPGLANVWGSDVFGGNPLHAVLDVVMNEDWKGREIYKPGAPVEDKARKIASYLYQAAAPSNALTPGGYQQQRILEGLAADAQADGVPSALVDSANAFAAALGFEGFTGERADGSPAAPSRDAVLASFGVKIRPVDLDAWERSRGFDAQHDVRELKDWQRDRARKSAEGRISDAQRAHADDLAQRDVERIQGRADKAFSAADFLRKRLPPK